MARFAIRRLIQMLLVLFAVSVLTFLVFNVIPGGDPAVRLAGRQPDPGQLERIRQEWGFDEPLYVQYVKTMKQVFSGDLVSYTTGQDVIDEIWKRAPRTFALAIGAAVMWMVFSVAIGLFTAVRAGRFSDRFLTVLALIGISMPVFWIGALMNYYLGFKWGLFPNGGYVPVHGGPVGVVLPPDHAVDRALDPVHRRLLARAALERARHDERRLRADSAREGPAGAPGAAPARAAQLADPDRDAVGARLRRGPRRRRDPHRDRLRPPGRRPVRGRVGRKSSTSRRCSRSRCSARSSS